jgi:cytochrome c nitrite reductase small subunit
MAIDSKTKLYFLICGCVGLLIGLSCYIFMYAKGYSYLVNDPKACANCHIMQDYYDSWTKSSHHKAASCNDCHVPHQLFLKYLSKAKNGYNHSRAFTMQDFKEPIRITESNLKQLQHNCIECHATLTSEIAGHKDVEQGQARCTTCHRSSGHMRLD